MTDSQKENVNKRTYSVYCDGGARGNPGPAGVGFVVYDDTKKVLVKGHKFIGKATNNVAEYWGVIEALKWLNREKGKKIIGSSLEIKFFLDSMLVVNQLNGVYRVKNFVLKNLVLKVRQLENFLRTQISYHHVRREKNSLADSLANLALDRMLKKARKIG